MIVKRFRKAKAMVAGLLCTAMVMFAGCGTAKEPEQSPEKSLEKITVGEVTHSIL